MVVGNYKKLSYRWQTARDVRIVQTQWRVRGLPVQEMHTYPFLFIITMPNLVVLR